MLAYLPSPSSGEIHIGPLVLHAYGLLYAVAVVAAVLICRRRWEKVGGSVEMVDEVALWGFPAA